jgi:hypothetical protein
LGFVASDLDLGEFLIRDFDAQRQSVGCSTARKIENSRKKVRLTALPRALDCFRGGGGPLFPAAVSAHVERSSLAAMYFW